MPRSRADGAKCPPGRLAERSVTNSAGDASRVAPYVVLGIALLAVSNGAIFARLAVAPPLAIAAWRVGLAVLVVLPLAFTAPRQAAANWRSTAFAAGAGALLAVHFATWIASLDHTTIARSVLLVSTSPIWVALLQFLAGRGPPSRLTLAALVLAIAGAAVVSGSGQGGEGALLGDVLAVVGGIAMAGYFLLSREAQSALSFRSYLGIAYGVAGAVLWAAVFFTDTQATGFDSRTWWALAGRRLSRNSSGTVATTGPSGTSTRFSSPSHRSASPFRFTTRLVANRRGAGLAYGRGRAPDPWRHCARHPGRASPRMIAMQAYLLRQSSVRNPSFSASRRNAGPAFTSTGSSTTAR